MKLFCSDLDNTLIYSYKKNIGKDKILVETKDGKELSYMTLESHSLLEQIKEKIVFIPLTTRSLEQYKRIDFYDKWKPVYALVANGGILLVNGKIDDEWFEDSKRLIKDAQLELERGISLLQKDKNVCFEVRKVDQLFVFTKSEKPVETLEYLGRELNFKNVSIHKNGSKVYIFPKVLNKGKALERIRKLLLPSVILAAGDSDFDVPMIQGANIGFYPPNLSDVILSKESVKIEEKLFSDGLLRYVNNLI